MAHARGEGGAPGEGPGGGLPQRQHRQVPHHRGAPCEESCGFDPVDGYYCTGRGKCERCADHCAEDETGCVATGERAWSCGEAGDGDDCRERLYAECQAGQACADGACACAPACDGKECGDDGCGGDCGPCAGGETCSAAFACVPDTERDAAEGAAEEPLPESAGDGGDGGEKGCGCRVAT